MTGRWIAVGGQGNLLGVLDCRVLGPELGYGSGVTVQEGRLIFHVDINNKRTLEIEYRDYTYRCFKSRPEHTWEVIKINAFEVSLGRRNRRLG